MTINDRNRFAFSYTGQDVRDKKFIYKNFNKSASYNSNFSNSIFNSSSFVGTKFKFCSMYGAIFDNCLIRGALFRNCNLQSATFKDSFITASVFEKSKFKDCKLINCKIVGSTNLKQIIPIENIENTEFFDQYPSETNFSTELLNIIEQLRDHDFIRRSTVLHRKKGKLDTISLKTLVDEFNEIFLIKTLPSAADLIKNDFHTLTYLQSVLRKLQMSGTY